MKYENNNAWVGVTSFGNSQQPNVAKRRQWSHQPIGTQPWSQSMATPSRIRDHSTCQHSMRRANSHFLHRVSASTTLSTKVTSLKRFLWLSRIFSGSPPLSARNSSMSSTISATEINNLYRHRMQYRCNCKQTWEKPEVDAISRQPVWQEISK